MGWNDCIASVRGAAQGALDRDQAELALEEVQARKARLLEQGLSETEAGRQAAAQAALDAKIAALIEKRSKAIAVVRKAAAKAYVDSEWGDNPARGLQALLVGLEGKRQGSAFSQDAQKQALLGLWMGGLVNDLRNTGALKALQESALVRALQAMGLARGSLNRYRALELDVARELWRMDQPEIPGTGNETAVAAAKAIHRWQEDARLKINEAGGWVRKLPGYIVRQSHDQLRIAGKGLESDYRAWRNTIEPLLDPRTFDTVKDKEQFLHNVWLALSSGVHEKTSGDWLGGFKGPGNLAKRLSQERVLHFKDADSWFAYNEKYGTGSVLESVISGFNSSARNLAALRVWGTNPEALFERIRGELRDKSLKAGDLKAVKLLEGQGKTGDFLKRQFEQVNGYLGIPESPTMARIGNNVRAALTMAKLGGVALSSIPDMAVASSVLKSNGMSFFDRWGAVTLGGVMRGGLTGADRAHADLWGAAIDGMIGSVQARIASTDHFAGRMHKLQDAFFRLNLLGFWTDRLKEGVSLAITRHLGAMADRQYGELAPALQTTLGRYGIDSGIWDMLRQHAEIGEDGRAYLTPDAVARVPGEDLAMGMGLLAAGEKEIARARFDLEVRLRSYLTEQVRDALTEPGAREKAAINLGTRPGTAQGELARFITQFKTFSYTFISRHFGREIQRADNWKGAAVNVASLIAGTTILGAISNMASDISKGRDPRQLFGRDIGADLASWNAALLKGGGLGIYGDFLFGTSNRFGQSLLETAAGPALGTISDFKRVLDATFQAGTAQLGMEGDTRHPGRTAGALALRFASGNLPFVNMFYTRAALDYLVVYRLQEAMNPGFLRRYEKGVKQRTGQGFWISPAKFVNQGQIAPSQ